MQEDFDAAVGALEQHPALYTLVAVGSLLALAWLANWLTKHVLLRGLRTLLGASVLARDGEPGGTSPMRVVSRLSNVVPALVLMIGVGMVPHLPEALVTVVQNVCSAFIVLTVALALGGLMNILGARYQRRPSARIRPIKGYVEVTKIVIYFIAAILMVASLVDRSPLILLSGLGAMAAVLMLIFQDTLLSLVASIQLASNDMVRIGDWIEMSQLNADGDVIDIALHTVKVQNFDKTITTIPTKRLISDSFRNWRGMRESGGRRIKRSLYIDQHSIRFLTDEERRRLDRFALLDGYLPAKEAELEAWNASLPGGERDVVNRRRVTNIGTFRAYVDRYLRHHPGVHQGMMLMVRQMAPTSDGLPLEIYCFSNSVVWAEYEGTQSDIFDHLLAILPEFGLRVFQHPSGADMRALGRGMQASEGFPAGIDGGPSVIDRARG
ncbi:MULTISPECIES: mechanosensitive ion channel family protein [unclassified Thauera]|uniref:mechanosensitive ion channel family protein n=1 Tax=unclassified Thauera TaxID=2609274 RepID=UPI0021E16A99|nr:mechanosensitive ion channel family protein [Thauera sp. Sel9]MCV2217568.1 mechanosensitive ion channel family protein [Thauera sp. Sel9]